MRLRQYTSLSLEKNIIYNFQEGFTTLYPGHWDLSLERRWDWCLLSPMLCPRQ